MLKHLEGDTAGAEGLLQEELTIAVDGHHVGTELGVRAELALCLADAGRPGDAEEHVVRCREILSQGEDWRGAVGRVALAEAAVLDGRLEDASERYLTAIEVFRRFGLPWDEAEAQNRFGRALLDGGDRRGAVETLAGALELYRRHGAGARWVERVLTDKLTAQGLSGQSFGASIDLVAAEVMKEAEDFFGANVALAARVAGAAQGGQILVSALLKELVESSGEFDFGPSWEAELKGISGTRRLHPVLWQESETP